MGVLILKMATIFASTILERAANQFTLCRVWFTLKRREGGDSVTLKGREGGDSEEAVAVKALTVVA